MLASPDPLMSHSLDGFPTRLFSQTMGFDPHACARGSDPVVRATPFAPSRMAARITREGRNWPKTIRFNLLSFLAADLVGEEHEPYAENEQPAWFRQDVYVHSRLRLLDQCSRTCDDRRA